MQLQHSYPPLNLNAKFFMQKLVDNEEIRGSVWHRERVVIDNEFTEARPWRHS